MTSSSQSRTNYGRRFFWLAVAIVVAGGAYTAGWFYAARLLVQEAQAAVATLNGSGRRASCENAEARGYPFRIGLFCRSVMFEDGRKGVAFQARSFRSAAQVYQPWRVIGELDSPARLEAPGIRALALDWASLRASARLSQPLPERLSLEGSGVAVRVDEPGVTLPALLRSDSAELHLRPAGDDLDVALRFAGLQLEQGIVGTAAVPPLSGLVDASLVDGALPGGLPSGRPGDLRGRSGTLRTLMVSTAEGAGLTVSGPVSVDEDGLLDAQLQVTVREPMALAKTLGDLAPHARREIELALSAIAAMGDNSAMSLRVVKGEASLGFIPLGTIPPL